MSVIRPNSGIDKGGYLYVPTDKDIDPFKSSNVQLQCGMFRDMVKKAFSDSGVTTYEVYEWLNKGADNDKPRKLSFQTVKDILELGVKEGYLTRKVAKGGK